MALSDRVFKDTAGSDATAYVWGVNVVVYIEGDTTREARGLYLDAAHARMLGAWMLEAADVAQANRDAMATDGAP